MKPEIAKMLKEASGVLNKSQSQIIEDSLLKFLKKEFQENFKEE